MDRFTRLDLPTFPPPGESVFDGKFYWPTSLWNQIHGKGRTMNLDEAKAWAAKELEYMDRRIQYENGDPMTRLSNQGLKDITDAREAIQALLNAANGARHTPTCNAVLLADASQCNCAANPKFWSVP